MTRKRIVLHIGLPKTGSSALQNYFSLNADALGEVGVCYPYREPDASIAVGNNSGNVVQICFRNGYVKRYIETSRQDGLLIRSVFNRYAKEIVEDIAQIARTSESSSLLLSGVDEHAWAELSSLSKEFDVSIVSFARDIFDYALSAWRQSAKMEVALFNRDFAAFVEDSTRITGYSKLSWCLKVGLPVTVVNYDAVRHDIVGAFFRVTGLPAPISAKSLDGNRYNVSLTASEALIAVRTASVLRNRTFAKTVVQMMLRRPNRPKDQIYYSRDIHFRLLDIHSDSLVRINHVILDGELSTSLRDSPSCEMSVNAEDVEVLLNAVRLASDLKDDSSPWRPRTPSKSVTNARGRYFVPPDFDPEAYLFLNPDVAKAGVDPRQHYVEHGRGELRQYSYS